MTDSKYISLIEAVKNKDIETVSLLLNRNDNLDINAVDENGQSALHHAVNFEFEILSGNHELARTHYMERIKIVYMLLHHPDINVNLQDKEGNTAFMLSVKKNHMRCSEMIFDRDSFKLIIRNNQGEYGWSPKYLNEMLIDCIRKKRNATALKLIANEVDLNYKNEKLRTPLLMAYENPEVLNIMLKYKRIDINTQGQFGKTLLHKAIKNNDYDLLKKLIKFPDLRFDILDNQNISPFELAIKENNAETISIIFNSGKINLNAQINGKPALFHAMETGKNKAALLMIMNKKCDIDIRNPENGDTPLIYSVRNRKDILSNALFKRGANINLKNNIGQDALSVGFDNICSSNKNCTMVLQILKFPSLTYESCQNALEMIKTRNLEVPPQVLKALYFANASRRYKIDALKEKTDKNEAIHTVRIKRPRIQRPKNGNGGME